MYLSVRKFSNVKSPEVVINKVQAELMPVIKELPGFVNYFATKFDDGDLGAISIFDTKLNADAASERAMGWVKQNLADHLPGEPMVMRGEVLFTPNAKSLTASA